MALYKEIMEKPTLKYEFFCQFLSKSPFLANCEKSCHPGGGLSKSVFSDGVTLRNNQDGVNHISTGTHFAKEGGSPPKQGGPPPNRG